MPGLLVVLCTCLLDWTTSDLYLVIVLAIVLGTVYLNTWAPQRMNLTTDLSDVPYIYTYCTFHFIFPQPVLVDRWFCS